MLLRQITDDGLAQYAYLIGCQRTGEALVIDPERDVDRYLQAAAAEGLRLTAAAETHIHADFLSGVRELASRGVTAYLSRAGDADWQYEWPAADGVRARLLDGGDVFRVGQIEVRALHTPGHTPEHLSFLVTDRGSGADVPIGVASGDFVFVGDVGRPDLLESAAGVAAAMRPAAAALGGSLRAFARLEDSVLVWPGHGAGSACGKALGAVPVSSVGYERRFNAALRLALDDPAAFVDAVLEGQPEPPPYFATMKHLNKVGPPLLHQLPEPGHLPAAPLVAALAARGTLVLDTRGSRRAFMSGHIPGALYTPLDRTFATVVGSYGRPDERIVLILNPDEVEPAVRQLVRIGFDRIDGYATPAEVEALSREGRIATSRIRATDFAGARARRQEALVIDVRSAGEFAAGHLRGAVNIPHTRLIPRLDELPQDRELVVHCATGSRAAVAAAALRRAGFDVTYVDDAFETAATA